MAGKALGLSLIGLGVLSILTVVVWAGEGQEEKVTLEQVPPAVKTSILKESAGGEITEIELKTKDGQTIYEAEVKLNGKEIDIRIAADGTVLGRESEEEEDDDDLTLDQIPPAAKAALMKLAAGGRIAEVELDRENGVALYEAAWSADGVEHEAAVTADGVLVELAESVPAGKAPSAVQAVIAQHFGTGTDVTVVKKMIVVYEVEAKINGAEKELLIFPTGRVHDAPKGEPDDDEEDDDNDDDGEDD